LLSTTPHFWFGAPIRHVWSRLSGSQQTAGFSRRSQISFPAQQVLAQQIPLEQSPLAQQPRQTPSQQRGVSPPQPPSSQHPLQTPPQSTGLSAGQAQTPWIQRAPPQHPPPSGPPQGPPISWQVGQQRVRLLQPELLIVPFGIVVRQKIAPLVLTLPKFAPLKSASTRQALPRFALLRLAPDALAPFRFAPERLQLVQTAPWRSVELLRSHMAR
jgi:hypothetical protein